MSLLNKQSKVLEEQYKEYLDHLKNFERVLSFEEWIDYEKAKALADLKEIESNENKLEDIIKFLEYEEAYTVDTRSQQRIANKLKELKLWN